MVIVDPDYISSFVLTNNRLCESSIDSDVVFPTILLPDLEFWVVRDLIMEGRPDDLFAVAVVMTFEIGIGYEHRNRSFLNGEIVGDVFLHSSAKGIRGLPLNIKTPHRFYHSKCSDPFIIL